MEIPVVSTQVAGIPELIESGRTGILVPEKDPQHWPLPSSSFYATLRWALILASAAS